MSRHLRVALVQTPAQSLRDFSDGLRKRMKSPNAAQLVIYPELHLCSLGVESMSEQEAVDAYAEPLDGPRDRVLRSLARELGIWLVPGTVLERAEDGSVYNTAVVYNPDGERAAQYRKVFTWRPYEPFCPGREFVVFDMPGHGRVGLSICYDSWYPEVTRHLAWMGAELVINLVQTPTTGRTQEIPLNQANAIVNQVWVASVNGASPTAHGGSLLVDPEGHFQIPAAGMEDATLVGIVDFDRVGAARTYGTSGDSWPWDHFREGDSLLELPLYNGYIDPSTWRPTTPHLTSTVPRPTAGSGVAETGAKDGGSHEQ
ncbi:carbon-nitrogen hydrolase family protein [Streptomyces sp. NBC_00006]|uniref:carbon-nitrogen hydrolase family protein n=1 Tax=Streptomyces sp. NBC_00006 TaxID=2975619 RepID=UPI0022527DFF|nr:carbon-nitrogen hydrolase family protein [Streptomyces sp. NBC_00006]MCX5529678.1 carbon-nitrogen hydrolase family protein [Streptomyces sp. NBC_00006]